MIAVKEMEMPKSCALCERFEGACKYTDFGDYQTKRNPSCPLVEIVTCKDCRHCFIDEDGHGYHCEKSDTERIPTCADFYCVHAERRE
jgi:hypothetical protein